MLHLFLLNLQIFEDETIAERIIALSEMFPEKVRNVSWTLATTSWSCLKATYGLSCNILWIVSTSAIILAAPPLIAHEREQIEEMNRQQQRQVSSFLFVFQVFICLFLSDFIGT